MKEYVRIEDLAPFIERVRTLKAEGLSTRIVAQRLCVPVATLNDRVRKYRSYEGGKQCS